MLFMCGFSTFFEGFMVFGQLRIEKRIQSPSRDSERLRQKPSTLFFEREKVELVVFRRLKVKKIASEFHFTLENDPLQNERTVGRGTERSALNIQGIRGTQRQVSENICSEDDLRSRIFGTFVVKFFACLLLLGFSNI